jgi:4-hydroxythreonine-4-phosphate dehydrogenase
MALKGEIDAIVTAPLNKQAMNEAGYSYAGHTEILAEKTGTKQYAMMLVAKSLRVVHVTTHVSLREACDLITTERVAKTIDLTVRAMRSLGFENPRIAVAGLNPHAGESGIFGREEIEEITPAVEWAKDQGFHTAGPISPDTVFMRAAKGDFDAVVAMYHDQGHIPIKLLGFGEGVNLTLGLPIIRTSVDHGTAFDIAGKGVADPQSLVEAIRLAAEMAVRRARTMKK